MKHESIPFFRPEVAGVSQQLGFGAIRLSQPISGWLAACFATLIVIGFFFYMEFGTVARKERVAGITVPKGGNVEVFALETGVVKRFLVSEGQQVEAGQPLFEISSERISEQGAISELVARQLVRRKTSLETEKRLRLISGEERQISIEKKIRNLRSEIEQVQQEIALAERRTHLVRRGFSRYQALQANGFISDLQLQQKEEDSISADVSLSNLRRTKLQIQENLLDAIAEQSALDRTNATEQAQIQGSLANLEQEIAENNGRRSTFITAPQGGNIATIVCQQGQVVNTGQTLATLAFHTVEQSRLEVQLYVPSRTVGFVSPGQTVLIRFDAFPYEKFGVYRGTITNISKTPFAPNELPQSLATTILSRVAKNSNGLYSTEGLYRVKVKLDQQKIFAYGKDFKIKPAMTLEADIIQERRKIWEWIASPILAVAKRQTSQ